MKKVRYSPDIKKIMKKYYYQLYVNKFEDLGEIDKFF